jgi:serine/threonine protein phosphatase 1
MPDYGHHWEGWRLNSVAMTYAIGDIHGSLTKLRVLIGRCEAHAASRPMIFVFLGDYIDRGPNAAGVVDLVIQLQFKLREHCIALMGNHEAMALDVIDGKSPAEVWLPQGGLQTLRSYGVARPRELPREHVDWLRGLRLTYDDGRRFYVHAGVDPCRPLDAQDHEDLVWMREPFLSYDGDYGRLIVHGHTPVIDGRPDLRRNRLNLDTGAVYGGPLTAAVFDATQTGPIGFLQAE